MKYFLSSLLLLSFIFIGCSGPNQKSSTSSNNDPKTAVWRTKHSYFNQEEFSWSLVTPDRVPLYVLEAGTGPTIITLHGGFGMEHSYMRTFMKPLEKSYHIVYYDQRGSLRSPVPENDFDEYITMENMVDDLDRIRTELGEEKVTLVAHSMGAVLAYEYLKVYPEKVNHIVIISGFPPKLPSTKAEFHDMFTSQKEREAFKNRPEIKEIFDRLKQTTDTTSATYTYLNWRVHYAACQTYYASNWEKVEGGMGFFNPHMNEIIGPENNIPWSYGLKFYWYQRQFDNNKLDENDTNQVFTPPINYLPLINQHKEKLSYMLGRYEFGDWNLRLYERYFADIENIEFHIFEKAAHNIWMDQPEAFQSTLQKYLSQALPTSLDL